jgi:predicted ATPase/class 3 adenylate cyclase
MNDPIRMACMNLDDPHPVTLLFTDIQGSTRLIGQIGDEAYRGIQATLSDGLRRVFRRHRGRVLDTQGDSFFVAFARGPLDAIAAALECQRWLSHQVWPDGIDVRIRMAIHTGLPRRGGPPGNDSYVGIDVHRAARLCEAAHGGQVLISAVTEALVRPHLPEGIGLAALGEHQLRDLAAPELIFQILAPDLASSFPPLRAPQTLQASLPVPRTAFFGRDRETGDILHLLADPEARLVTLTGPGGTGKTRLAIAVARAAAGMFRDGACYVALAPVADPHLVASLVVRCLGLQEAGPTPPEDLILGHLRQRRMLLVFDNFEHILPAASLVADLLSGCPAITVLTTSRAALRLSGEHDYAVPPLGLPDLTSSGGGEALFRYPAVELFVERATRATPHFEATADNLAAIARICVRLDGLPLAIELAAARTSILSPQEILAQLDRPGEHGSMALLTDGARDAPARHRTLRNAIQWSLDLLAPEACALFARLSAFVGSFDLEAAFAIGSIAPPALANNAPEWRPRSLASIGTLVENSLLQRVERTGSEARFSMLETIREYALDRLCAADEGTAARLTHARHYASLAEAGAKELGGARQAQWLVRLEDDHPNFRAALSWSLSSACTDPDVAIRLATALWIFWFRRAHLREGSRWIEQVNEARGAAASPVSRATLLTADGSFARMIGDFERAAHLLEAATSIWRDLHDREGTAWALSHLGLAKQWLGELDAGVEILEESLGLRVELGEDRGIARSLFHLAIAEDFRGRFGKAAELYQRTLEIQQRIGDNWGSARVLGYLAKVLLRSGDDAGAEPLCERALKLSEEVADRWGIGLAQAGLGGVSMARGILPLATERLKASLLIFRDVGAQDRVAECLQDLALVARRMGATEQSVRLSAGAATIQRASRFAFWPALQAQRDAELAEARNLLGEARFMAVWTQGCLMSAPDAIEDALSMPA